MVTIDIILQEYFDLIRFSKPICYVKKSKLTTRNKLTRGWISIQGIEFNIDRFNTMDVVFFIKYNRSFFLQDFYKRERFGFLFYIDNFVYGSLYSAIAAYLLSQEHKLPVFFGFSFRTYNLKDKPYPRRYIKGFRYADKDLLLVGKLILEEWLKMRRKENPSFMSEMSLN